MNNTARREGVAAILVMSDVNACPFARWMTFVDEFVRDSRKAASCIHNYLSAQNVLAYQSNRPSDD
jgi:hypothetical protein